MSSDSNSSSGSLRGSRRPRPVIAIDGPAGAGKSTLASQLARKLGYLNLETGAMYRALGLKAIENDVSLDDEDALYRLAQDAKIVLEPKLGGNRVLLDSVDVSLRIREKDVTDAASRASVHPRVREWMVQLQRKMGEQGGVVMEGRDIGTVVFPDAEVKIFLDADPEVRGNRRFSQTGEATPQKGTQDQAAILEELRARDHRDRNRASSPLAPANDAVVIDSTHMNFDQVMARAEEIIREKTAGH